MMDVLESQHAKKNLNKNLEMYKETKSENYHSTQYGWCG